MTKELQPGSDDALAAGCLCTSKANNNGAGWFKDGAYYGWDVAIDCPLHGLPLEDGQCRFCGEQLLSGQTACWGWKCYQRRHLELLNENEDLRKQLAELRNASV